MRKLFVASLIAAGLSLLALAPAQAQGGCGHYYYRGSDGFCYAKGGNRSNIYGDGYSYGYGYRAHRPWGYQGYRSRRGWGDDGYRSYGGWGSHDYWW